jgi:hypothetical protein
VSMLVEKEAVIVSSLAFRIVAKQFFCLSCLVTEGNGSTKPQPLSRANT